MLSDNYFKNGFTFTSWIWVDKIEDQDVQVILDSRGPYQSIDDNEDLEFTHDAFQMLCFTDEELWNVYKGTSAVMNLGELVNTLGKSTVDKYLI